MKKFEYLIPTTLNEAISLYESHAERAKYIAGGTDVMVKIKEGKMAPDYLISLKNILGQERQFLKHENDTLRISALATHRVLEESSLIRTQYPILYDAVKNIGSVQIRNVATIGGNLVNAVPSADGAIPLIALDAKVSMVGPKGARNMDLVRFFLGPGQCDLEHGEILTEITIPPLLPRTGGAYIKHGRREAMELPMLGVGVLLSLKEDLLTCLKARVCLGVAAPTPFRAQMAEEFLEGKIIDAEILAEAGTIAGKESRVRDSIRGVAWYRREMVGVLVRRMGLKALERIGKQLT
jgi:carbon-monoxide dehydrogenase medium subunit